jgi:hypothetical protein
VTKLLVEELISYIEQEFVLSDRRIHHIKSIRPYLYVHNNPMGTFLFEIKKGNTTLFSKSFTSSDLYNALNTTNKYAHLVYDIPINKLPLKNGTYKLKLSSSGYLFSGNSFLGWVKEYENLKNPATTAVPNDASNPLSFEIWEYN